MSTSIADAGAVTEYNEVDKGGQDILDARIGRGGIIECQVNWKGHDKTKDTWECLESLSLCAGIVREFNRLHGIRTKFVSPSTHEYERSAKRQKHAPSPALVQSSTTRAPSVAPPAALFVLDSLPTPTKVPLPPTAKATGSKRTETNAQKKAHKCEFPGCTAAFSTSSNLVKHFRVHTGERPFECDVEGCGSTFNRKSSLQVHSRVHTGERPFVCQHVGCTSAFAKSGNLKSHVRTHTGERPFKCDFNGCNAKFTTSSNKKAHVRTHTSYKPFKCPLAGCAASFGKSSQLLKHYRGHIELAQHHQMHMEHEVAKSQTIDRRSAQQVFQEY